VSFLGTQGVPPFLAPEEGSTLRKLGRAYLFERNDLNMYSLFIHVSDDKGTKPRGSRGKSDVAVRCSTRW
jgi:hypothetical protein